MFSYTLGKASSNGLNFSSNPFILSVNGREDDYDFSNVNDIDKLSDLDYMSWEVSLAADYSITKQLGLTATYTYSDYQDDQEYVYGDTSGDCQAIAAFLTWKF